MKLRKKILSHRDAEVATDSLNDILFILVMFFLIVATLANPNVIRLSQPKSASDTKSKQTVVVSIDVNKNYFVGTTKVVGDSAMKQALIPILQKAQQDPTIVINADKTVPIEYVVGVMKIARELKAKAVLAVAKP